MNDQLTARPIRFTADLTGWRRIVETLGGCLIAERPGWLVYALGSGRLALHQASAHQPPGTGLAFETTTPLPRAVEQTAARGIPITLEHPDHGEAGIVTGPGGVQFTLESPTPVDFTGAQPERRLSSLSICYGPDPAMIRSIIEGLGAQPRIVGDDGTWTDLSCAGGGLVGIHAADAPGTELAFEWDGDVEDALALLVEAGIDAVLIDETYSRTVQIADPDGVKEIWVNERQTDLYGYRRVASR